VKLRSLLKDHLTGNQVMSGSLKFDIYFNFEYLAGNYNFQQLAPNGN